MSQRNHGLVGAFVKFKHKGSIFIWLIVFVILLRNLGVKSQGDETIEEINFIITQTINISRFQSKEIFPLDKCSTDMECTYNGTTRKHTLCRDLPVPICNRFEHYTIYRVNAIKLIKLQEMIVDGHNGLRNRIAEKMQVGNMVELSWDDRLAEMSLAYYLQCQPDVDDPCTLFKLPEEEGRQTTDFNEKEKELFKWVSQNRFTMAADFFPTNFIEIALRAWYFEKDTMEKPFLTRNEYQDLTYGTVIGDNNFVHMAYPLSFRIGCSIAQIDSSFNLICNYYPFYRFVNNSISEMTFIRGEPAKFCPAYFPLKHESFPNLCTDLLNRGRRLTTTPHMAMTNGKVVLLVLVWLIFS